MLINFEKQKVIPQALLSGKINENNLSASERAAVIFLRSWLRGENEFKMHTSGSTGEPKSILLSRETLTYSARTSLEYLDPNHSMSSTLLTMNPGFIGGIMVMVRALIADLDLTILEPKSDFSHHLTNNQYDLVSLVPLQVQKMLHTNPVALNRFKTILIGGAPLNANDIARLRKEVTATCYHTYGMTETASHIALKNLTEGSQLFETLGDICIDQDDRGCLMVKGTVTNHQWIQTNDMVEIINFNAFKWLGRSDFVINSGGLKIHPELLELALSEQLKMPFFVVGIPDDTLGEKAILLLEAESVPAIDFSGLPKYHSPKEIILVKQFEYTSSGKINRKATLENLKP